MGGFSTGLGQESRKLSKSLSGTLIHVSRKKQLPFHEPNETGSREQGLPHWQKSHSVVCTANNGIDRA